VLGHLGELGTEAHGAVGSDEPLQALEDAIREFAPDHVLIALRPSNTSGWQEQGLVERTVERFGLPVTVVQIGGREHAKRLASVVRGEAATPLPARCSIALDPERRESPKPVPLVARTGATVGLDGHPDWDGRLIDVNDLCSVIPIDSRRRARRGLAGPDLSHWSSFVTSVTRAHRD